MQKTLSVIDGLLEDAADTRPAIELILRTHDIQSLRLRAILRRAQRKADRPAVLRSLLLSARQLVIEGGGQRGA